jgi:hypothetical protein
VGHILEAWRDPIAGLGGECITIVQNAKQIQNTKAKAKGNGATPSCNLECPLISGWNLTHATPPKHKHKGWHFAVTEFNPQNRDLKNPVYTKGFFWWSAVFL